LIFCGNLVNNLTEICPSLQTKKKEQKKPLPIGAVLREEVYYFTANKQLI